MCVSVHRAGFLTSAKKELRYATYKLQIQPGRFFMGAVGAKPYRGNVHSHCINT